jgi:hypothetical protein
MDASSHVNTASDRDDDNLAGGACRYRPAVTSPFIGLAASLESW